MSTAGPSPRLPSTLADRIADGPIVLDGGLATLLEAHGHDLTSELWSARLLAENPAAITAAHREYFEAGAQVAITSSYQASFQGFEQLGLDRRAGRGAAAPVGAAGQGGRRSADRPPAARRNAGSRHPSVPTAPRWPTARSTAATTGSRVAELREWHKPRLEILADSGADVLALETIPCLAEAEALLRRSRRWRCRPGCR